jgi:undecaprenyl-phosphate galactose phosphotransferase
MSLSLTRAARAGRLAGRREGSLGQRLLPLADLGAMALCFTAGGLVNFSYRNVTEERTLILALLSAACLAAFHYLGHYSRRRPFWQEQGDLVTVAAVALVFDAALLYLLKVNFSRLWVLTSWGLLIPALPLARGLLKRACEGLGAWKRPTVVVGTRGGAREIAQAYASDLHLGYEVTAFLDPGAPAGAAGGGAGAAPAAEGGVIEVAGRRVPVVPLEAGTGRVPGWLGRPHVVVALELDEMPGREGLIERLSLRHGDIDIISPLRGLPINNTRVTHFFSRDLLSLRIHNNLGRPLPRLLKRGFDLAAAGLLLLFLAPLMAAIALKLRLADRGPVLFAHARVGRDGTPFRCLKFRSMVPNAKEVLERLLASDPAARAEWERDYKLKDDPRITPFGRLLRRTSLDELPQLLNVVRGDMSLVGPRPVVPAELDRYGEAKVYYLQVRPGLTGLWQVSGRNDVDYERRVSLDAWYVRNWTLWYDILILLKTLLVVPSRSSGAY